MTREEQIEKKAHRVSYNTYEYHSFIEGAEWADKTMIDKACEWLKDNLYDSLDRDGRPTIDSPSCTNVNEFIKEFRKAMEE